MTKSQKIKNYSKGMANCILTAQEQGTIKTEQDLTDCIYNYLKEFAKLNS